VIWRIASNHGVAPLVYANLRSVPSSQLGIPAAIEHEFKLHLFQNIARKNNAAREIGDCLVFLKRRSIAVMLAKGAALDLEVYQRNWYTYSEDVDMVFDKRSEEIPDVNHAEMLTYLDNLNQDKNPRREHLEFDYFEHHDITMNGILPVSFDDIWQEAVRVRVQGQDAYIMTPENMMIAACVGSCRKRFLRLKHLLDIRETLNVYMDFNWQEFTRKARGWRCRNIAYTALMVTNMTLGCKLPGEGLRNLKVNPTREKILDSLAEKLCRGKFLASLADQDSRKFLGRRFNPALLLTYAAYSGDQVVGKIGEILHA
jgi:hypothetical protein